MAKILLIKRGKHSFKDFWGFPGGRIEQKDNDISEAAYRELKEEISISDIKLEHIKTIDNNKRDPRGFTLTNVFISKVPHLPKKGIRAVNDAVDFKWFHIKDLPDMAFDHKEILQYVIDNLL